MPGNKYTKSFQGDNNANNANELASHNRFVFAFDGVAIAMVVGFVLLLVSAAIIYLIVAHAALVIFVVVGGFAVISFVGLIVGLTVLISFGIRHVSNTTTQLQVDAAQKEWTRMVYPLGAHIVLRDPQTRQLSVHNASIITENRHYQPGQITIPQEAESLMPSLYDLTKDDAS